LSENLNHPIASDGSGQLGGEDNDDPKIFRATAHPLEINRTLTRRETLRRLPCLLNPSPSEAQISLHPKSPTLCPSARTRILFFVSIIELLGIRSAPLYPTR